MEADLATPCLISECYGNILAPEHQACQCFAPILPQCDNFLIIVFPHAIVALLDRTLPLYKGAGESACDTRPNVGHIAAQQKISEHCRKTLGAADAGA
ncbi:MULTISPECIES: hypothetical protein [unclassified Caballeronia]|uniref:hypothetical protein n=1 Tax=unclassified Caballeronia TaxID=2646786 RepID=UPI00286793F7|nr:MULTISPECIES: hypothetical protein [unclassified Caballeronia]MDR5750482.1 hypothetical protein [Caballeronia sp. LZ024]MDR5842485.1 hypothetical protein [Caballeronia sp. LZ031]